MTVVLHQFAFSHFNEKARWALAHKGLAHTRETYLPGPHISPIKKLSGQTATPVLEMPEAVISGSAAIIAHLEQSCPHPALYPTDPVEKDAALALQQHFDAVVGPAVRTVLFSALVMEGGYLTRMFAGSKSALKRGAYRAMFPVVRPLIARGNGVADPANVQASFTVTSETLDRVAAMTDATGFCVGEAFSVADLTVAALLAPIAGVSHPDMQRPEPMPASVAELVGRYARHPAIEWVNRIYARHRPA